MQRLLPIVAGCVLAGVGAIAGSMQFALLGGVAGLLVGVYWPIKVVDRRIRERSEDILFYLPLVIEQVSIGVSSSLDIGPCLARVVQMADERDSHNPVTELVRYAQYHVKSGVSLEEALVEVGRLSGSVELKHAFMALAQVAKFGGEVSRQLQELADAVATQRETKIEAQIKKLELKATAPVSLVFLGYILNLLCGFMLQVIVNL
jgi:pilus assembly protein TadC